MAQIERLRETLIRGGKLRNAFVLTTVKWELEGKGIIFWANPSEVGWNIAVRGSLQNTHGGNVYHTWKVKNASRGGRDTYYEFPQLSFQFQAGNLLPFSMSDENVKVTPGLNNFYSFMEMIDQDRIVQTNDGLTSNFHRLTYYSTIFPGMRLEGYFTPEGLSFSDSAENQNTVNWSSTMIVYKTTPKFYRASALANHFNALGFKQLPTPTVKDPI